MGFTRDQVQRGFHRCSAAELGRKRGGCENLLSAWQEWPMGQQEVPAELGGWDKATSG